MYFSVHKTVFTSLLEFTLPPLKKRELSIAESSLSNTLTESDKKSVEQVASHSEVQEMSPPPNFEARMKNVIEAVVELHLTICYPLSKVLSNDKINFGYEKNNIILFFDDFFLFMKIRIIKVEDSSAPNNDFSGVSGKFNKHSNLQLLFRKLRKTLIINEMTEDVSSYIHKVLNNISAHQYVYVKISIN